MPAVKKDATASENSADDVQKRADRLKSLRKAIGYSTREFEAKYHIKASTLKNWEQAQGGGLTANGALKIIAALSKEGIHCTLDWLLYGKGIEPQPLAKMGPTSKTGPSSNTLFSISQELRLFHELHPNAIDTIVNDDGMEPYFNQGDYVAGIRQFDKDIEKLMGKNCIVHLQTGQVLVRQLNSSDKKDSYTLSCTNKKTTVKPTKLDDVQLFSAAHIIWRRCLD